MRILISESSSKKIFPVLASRLVLWGLLGLKNMQLTLQSSAMGVNRNQAIEEPRAEKLIDTKALSSAFNTSIISTRLDQNNVEADLETLLTSPEFSAILVAAQSLAQQLQLSPEAATERLIQNFRNIDACWEKILLKKGAQSLLNL